MGLFTFIRSAWLDGWNYDQPPPPDIPVYDIDLVKAYNLQLDALHERQKQLQRLYDAESDKLKKSKIGVDLTNILVKVANIEKKIDKICNKYYIDDLSEILTDDD